jgi:hypothetical protein
MAANSTNDFLKATYTEQRIPQYAGNPLIEALPALGNEEEVLRTLMALPNFNEAQRDWDDQERIAMIAQLSNFMVPLERHIQLAFSLDSMMRQGYVGRIPHSMRSQEIFKKLHEKSLLKTSGDITPQISASLIGISGMGKTSFLKRYLSRIPQVIHHPDYGIYQIPYLHIETPYDGASVKGLAHSIFRKVDMLLPGAKYTEQYSKGKGGAETLMNHAARILHMHCVGLLIVDEIQNLTNSPKNRQALMTLLVSASNELGVPILFVGTPKARNLLSLNFRQARRSIGYGIPLWERLDKHSTKEAGQESSALSDWDVFSQTLIRYQWLRKPINAESKPHLANLLYERSQGIIDIAIKLFATAQIRAILDGSETISGQLLDDVAKRELSMLVPMIEALRRNDANALQDFDDIAPISLNDLIARTEVSYAGKHVNGASVYPNTSNYNQMLTSVLQTVGFDNEKAELLTAQSTEMGATNALDGIQKALKQATSGPKSKKTIKAESSTPISYDPGDYRNVLLKREGSALDRYRALRMLPDLDSLFAF